MKGVPKVGSNKVKGGIAIVLGLGAIYWGWTCVKKG